MSVVERGESRGERKISEEGQKEECLGRSTAVESTANGIGGIWKRVETKDREDGK